MVCHKSSDMWVLHNAWQQPEEDGWITPTTWHRSKCSPSSLVTRLALASVAECTGLVITLPDCRLAV